MVKNHIIVQIVEQIESIEKQFAMNVVDNMKIVLVLHVGKEKSVNLPLILTICGEIV